MTTHYLNIALLVKSNHNNHLPEWQYQLLQRVLALWQVHLRMIILAENDQENVVSTPLDFALRLLKIFDRLGHKSLHDPFKTRAFKDLCSADLFYDLEDTMLQADYREQSIDILLDLADCRWLPKYFFSHTRYGVWRIFADSIDNVHSQWAGVRSHCSEKGQLCAGILRQTSPNALSNGFNDSCIFLSSNRTSPLFLHRSLEPLLWKMVGILPRLLQQLRNSSNPEQMLRDRQQRYSSQAVEVALRQARGSGSGSGSEEDWHLLWQFLRISIVGKWSVLMDKVLAKKQWVLLYGERNQLENLKRLIPPADKFWADPQLIRYQQRWFIFFEEWVDQYKKGHIACVEWHGGDSFSPAVPVLEEDFHLSYPHVFTFTGEYYMIPESADNRTITLYRCIRFPDRWEFMHNLMEDVEAYDATLQEYQGRWWLFVNICEHEGCAPDDLLYLYSADSPLSKNWLSHPNNPIVSEVDRARSAGRIMHIGDKFYRPSQNCTVSYGRGLNLNQIVQWNSEQYQEQTLRQYIPDGKSGLYGMHSFSMLGDRILSDGIVKYSRWKRKN